MQHLLDLLHCLTRIDEILHSFVLNCSWSSTLLYPVFFDVISRFLKVSESFVCVSAYFSHAFRPNDVVQAYWKGTQWGRSKRIRRRGDPTLRTLVFLAEACACRMPKKCCISMWGLKASIMCMGRVFCHHLLHGKLTFFLVVCRAVIQICTGQGLSELIVVVFSSLQESNWLSAISVFAKVALLSVWVYFSNVAVWVRGFCRS